MENNDQIILNHYKKVAKNFGPSSRATMKDDFIREAEVLFAKAEIDQFTRERGRAPVVLDIGCGNGHLLSEISSSHPFVKIFGIEFTPELFEVAKARMLPHCEVFHGDVRTEDFIPHKVDLIISERVLINILDWDDRMKAMDNIISQLNPQGRLIIMESFQEPLVKLNRARKEMKLERINASYQNCYLREKEVQKWQQKGLREIPAAMPSNYLSSHFYLTRVLHPRIRPEGGKIQGTEFMKFMDQAFPKAIGNYSPILFRSFEKSDEGKDF